MNDRPPSDLGDIWHDGPTSPRQAKPSSGKKHPARSRKAGSRQTRPRVRRRWLAALGYGALAFACLGAAAIAFLLVAAPVDLVRDRVIEQVRARTGRDLVVAGPTSLSLFPRPAISLSDVSLSAPEGLEAPPTLVVPTLEAELRLWSLLAAQPAVERITLHRPTIELSVDAQGRRSWDLTSVRSRRSRSLPATDSTQAQQSSGEPTSATEPRQTTIQPKFGSGSVRVLDGTIRYRDHGTGSHAEIEALNVTLATDGPDAPLKIDGSLVVRGAKLAIAATVSPIQGLLTDQPARLALKVAGAPFEGHLSGHPSSHSRYLARRHAQATGRFGASPGRLARSPSAGKRDGDAVTFSTDLKATPARVALSNLQATSRSRTMTGSLALDTRQAAAAAERQSAGLGTRFRQTARQARPQSHLRTGAFTPPSTTPHAAPPPASPPRRHRRRRRAGSRHAVGATIPLTFQFSVCSTPISRCPQGASSYKDVKTGLSPLVVALEGGIGKVTIGGRRTLRWPWARLSDARRHGEVLVARGQPQARRRGPRTRCSPMRCRFPWLEGRGGISLALAGQGLSERQIVEALNGKVEMASTDGAIVGLDVGKIVRNLQRARLPSLEPSPDEKTPFSELSGTFTVTNGIAKNQDLRLVSTHLQLNGEGTLDLGPRQIDYTVRTKIGGGAPDPGATIKVGTLEVPVGIVGPWEKPTFGIKGQEQLDGHAEADRQEPQISGRSGRNQRPAARRRREAREAARPDRQAS